MAAPKSTELNRVQRRLTMVALRRKGYSYERISLKFGIHRNSARQVVLKACNGRDPKHDQTH